MQGHLSDSWCCVAEHRTGEFDTDRERLHVRGLDLITGGRPKDHSQPRPMQIQRMWAFEYPAAISQLVSIWKKSDPKALTSSD
jgi:hypothetical protein